MPILSGVLPSSLQLAFAVHAVSWKTTALPWGKRRMALEVVVVSLAHMTLGIDPTASVRKARALPPTYSLSAFYTLYFETWSHYNFRVALNLLCGQALRYSYLSLLSSWKAGMCHATSSLK